MNTNERPRRPAFLTFPPFFACAGLCLGLTASALLVGCPAGTGPKTSVELTGVVKVGADNCKEDRTSHAAVNVSPEMSLLDCINGEVGGTVRVLFPRKAWLDIKANGAVDAGPGK
jgi:hypothetical protein